MNKTKKNYKKLVMNDRQAYLKKKRIRRENTQEIDMRICLKKTNKN